MAPMTAAFTADINHFIAARGLDLVRFARGQRKDDVTREYLRRAELDGRGLVPAQVLYAGVAQEKQKVFRTSKRRNPVTGGHLPIGWCRASGGGEPVFLLRLCRTSGGDAPVSSEEYPVAEKGEAGAPEHLPFDHFRLVVHSFCSPVVVRERDCGGGGLDVEFEAAGEGVEMR